MAITHHDYTNDTHTISHEGRVIKVETIHYHVPSDNAMIDSGVSTVAQVWQNGRVEQVTLTSGRDSSTWADGQVDADDATAQKAKDYLALVAWIRGLKGAEYEHARKVRESKEIKKGCMVEVVAGRKVKKGTKWYAATVGTGQYGPYAHLSSEPNGRGEYIRYVSTENLRAIGQPTPEMIYPDCPFGPVNANIIGTALNLLEYIDLYHYNWAASEYASRWNILHDAWEDSGFAVPDAVRRATFRTDE